MSADATNTSKPGMDCDIAAREELLEGYVAGTLNEEERDAFEEHYFGCEPCFEALQTLQAIREELRQHGAELEPRSPPRAPRWAQAAALAAAVVFAVGTTLWLRQAAPPGVPEATPPRLGSPADSPRPPRPPESTRTPVSEPSLEQLARIQPPPYRPLTLRGVPDEATARFQRGMERYRKTDFAGAIAELQGAAELDPDATHIAFFLGICHLMVGQDDAGIARLRATIGLGDSPYLEEAHLYLGKALLRRKDIGGAAVQLEHAVKLRGSTSDEAARLLTGVQKLKRGSN